MSFDPETHRLVGWEVATKATIPVALSDLGISAATAATFYLATGGLTGLNATVQTLIIDQTAVNTAPTKLVLSGNNVIFNEAGTYEATLDCYLNQSSTSRSEYSLWLEINGGELPGSRAGNYQRGYDSGSSSSITTLFTVTAGQALRARVQRTDGGSNTGYQDNNGTRLTIKKIA